MNICKNCKHWKGDRNIDWVDDGECDRIRGALRFDVEAGWNGGYVDTVYTDSCFGCALFEATGVEPKH